MQKNVGGVDRAFGHQLSIQFGVAGIRRKGKHLNRQWSETGHDSSAAEAAGWVAVDGRKRLGGPENVMSRSPGGLRASLTDSTTNTE